MTTIVTARLSTMAWVSSFSSIPESGPVQTAAGTGIFALRTVLEDESSKIRVKAAEGLPGGWPAGCSNPCEKGLATKSRRCGSPWWWRTWDSSAAEWP